MTLSGRLPVASAALGDSAAEAAPVGADGHFSGTVAPQASTWFRFAYAGGAAVVTISVTQEPVDATRTDLLLYTGSLQDPLREPGAATRNANTHSQTFSDANPRGVLIRVLNDNSDRAVTDAVGALL